MSDQPQIRITVNGKPAATVEMAAPRYGLTASGMRTALSRLGFTAENADGMLDGRKPLYLLSRLDRAMTDTGRRPGKGSPGQPRPHRPATQNGPATLG